MHGWGIGAKSLTIGGLAAGLSVAAVARAQDGDGGLKVDLTVSEQIRASDNPDFTANGTSDIRSVTDLTLAIASANRTERFSFDAGASLELGNGSEVNPFANLTYARESASALFDFGLNYRESDIADSILFADIDGDLIPDLLVNAGGKRQVFGANVMLELGRDAPFGTIFKYDRTETDYVNSTSPGLFDGTRDNVELRFRLDLSQRVSMGIFARQSETDEDPGGTDEESQQIGISLDIAFNQALRGEFNLSSDKVETQIGNAVPVREDGLSFSASMTQDWQNGSFTGAFDSTIDDTGRRQTLTLRRALDLPDGDLSFSVGATRLSTGTTRPLFGLNYRKELPTAVLSAGLRQTPGTNDVVDTVSTVFDLSYVQEVSPASSLETSLSLRDVDGVNAPASDARSVNLSLSYRHELGQDWDVVGGYEYRKTTSGTAADVSSNTVFFGLSKSLSWRP